MIVADRVNITSDHGADEPALHELACGLPRRINRLADLALLIGYAEECRTIDAAQLASVNDELVTVAPE